MSLLHAILGFLSYQPRTGYDLKTECFDESVTHFWPADQAQIYRTLDKLVEQGLVDSHMEIQNERPNRKVYHITEAGRAELTAWLQTPQPLPAHREPFLVQLYFSGELPDARILAQINQQSELHRKLIATYRQTVIPDPDTLPTASLKRRILLGRLTLDMGMRMEQMYLDWLNDAAEIVKTLPESE